MAKVDSFLESGECCNVRSSYFDWTHDGLQEKKWGWAKHFLLK